MAELTLDREYHAKGIQLLCGVDEAGRGPLAGPVFAAAVILPADKEIPGLNDSKKLSEKKREALYDVIRQEALAYCVASASEVEIDELNILGATFLAMHRAGTGVGGWQPGPQAGTSHRNGHQGGRTVPGHCGGVHSGEGIPGPVYAGTGSAVSGI